MRTTNINTSKMVVKYYGKSREILGRKMAHITFLLNGKTHSERYDEAQILLTMVRDIWPSPNA